MAHYSNISTKNNLFEWIYKSQILWKHSWITSKRNWSVESMLIIIMILKKHNNKISQNILNYIDFSYNIFDHDMILCTCWKYDRNSWYVTLLPNGETGLWICNNENHQFEILQIWVIFCWTLVRLYLLWNLFCESKEDYISFYNRVFP